MVTFLNHFKQDEDRFRAGHYKVLFVVVVVVVVVILNIDRIN